MIKKIIWGIALVAQLVIYLFCFRVCTSTIPFIPWFEPLTMGAFFDVISIIPVQLILSILIVILYVVNKPLKEAMLLSVINLFILISMRTIPYIYEPLFYLLTYSYSIIAPILIIFLIKASIRLYRN